MSNHEREFRLADFVGILRRRSVLILGCAIILCLFLGLVAVASHPIYEARGSFQILTQGGTLGLVSEFFSLGGAGRQVTSEVEIVRSRSIADAVIAQCDLRLDVEDITHGGPIGRAFMFVLSDRLRRGLREMRVDNAEFPPDSVDSGFIVTITDESGGFKVRGPHGDLGTGRLGGPFRSESLTFTANLIKGPIGTRFRLTPRDKFQTLLGFREHLRVTTLGGAVRSDLIQVSYRDRSPSLARDVVNAIMREYERRQREWESQQGAAQTEQIELQLADSLRSLRQAETALEEYKSQHGVVALPDEVRLAVTDLSQREAERIDISLRLSMLQQIHTRLAADVAGDTFAVPPTLTADPVIERLASDHARLMLELSDLLLDYTENHPSVIAKREAIREVRASVLEVLAATITGLIDQRNDLDGVIGRLEETLFNVPGVERELIELQRDLEVADGAYRLLVRRRDEVRLLESSVTTGNRVVDEAVEPARPAAPSIRRNMATGLGLGLLLGLFLAFLVEILDPLVRRPEELLGLLGGAPLAVIKKGDADEISKAAAALALASMRTESRSLALIGVGPDTPSVREGIEAMASELARSLRPILLVDSTTARLKSSFFGSATTPGLSEIAEGREALPQQAEEARILLIPPGASPGSLQVSSSRVREKMTALRKDAELTLIYAPGVASDPALRSWGALCGGAVLLVVRNRDLKAETIAACGALESEGVRLLGAFLFD